MLVTDPHTVTRHVASGKKHDGSALFEDHEVMTEQEAYTIMGLAWALGTGRETLLD